MRSKEREREREGIELEKQNNSEQPPQRAFFIHSLNCNPVIGPGHTFSAKSRTCLHFFETLLVSQLCTIDFISNHLIMQPVVQSTERFLLAFWQ